MLKLVQVFRIPLAFVVALGSVSLSGQVAPAAPSYHEVVGWAHLPVGTNWGVMTAVAVDAAGNIFTFQRSDPTSKVIVFGPNGNWLRTGGRRRVRLSARLADPLRDGAVWIADRQMQQVLKFDVDGKPLMSLGKKGVAARAALPGRLMLAHAYDTVIRMEEILTIRLPKGTRRRLERRAKAQKLSVSQLVRRALEQDELLTSLASARAELLPQARAQGIYTDEDVFAIVS